MSNEPSAVLQGDATVEMEIPASAKPRPVTPLGILVGMLDRIVTHAADLPDCDPALRASLDEARTLAGGLERYVLACTTRESPALAELSRITAAVDWAGRFDAGDTALELEQEMLSGHLEGQFLKMLVHAMRAERILEIGMFTGYSALAMAEALPEHGRLIACEFDPFAAQVAREAFSRSPHGAKIRIELGAASVTLDRLTKECQGFDIIFIDADKAGYVRYFEAILDGGLLAPGGLICVDNTLMQGLPYMPDRSTANGEAVARFNKVVVDDPRVEQVLLPLRDGLTLIRRVDASPDCDGGNDKNARPSDEN